MITNYSELFDIFVDKSARILILGLEGSGKSTLL